MTTNRNAGEIFFYIAKNFISIKSNPLNDNNNKNKKTFFLSQMRLFFNMIS